MKTGADCTTDTRLGYWYFGDLFFRWSGDALF